MQSFTFHHFTPRPATDLVTYFGKKVPLFQVQVVAIRLIALSGDVNGVSRVRDMSCCHD